MKNPTHPAHQAALARVALLLLLVTFLLSARVGATSATLIAVQGWAGCDGPFQNTTITDGSGKTWSVWQTTGTGNAGNDTYLYFQVPAGYSIPTPAYVKFQYYDSGVGLIKMEYDATNGNTTQRSETHSRSSRVNTGQIWTSYQRLDLPKLAKGQGSGNADLRLDMVNWDTTAPLSIVQGSAVIQDTPFTDPGFTLAATKPWQAPYSGPSREMVDNTTLKERVLCGYQGWFAAPNDPRDEGWFHWCKGSVMKTANFNTDQWPDLTDYPATSWIKAADIVTKSGKQAYVFSSADPDAVHTHFKWMRKHNIDGVFLQRFLKTSTPTPGTDEEWALANVREAAHLEGRLWAIEWDVSYLDNSNVMSKVQADWNWLVANPGFNLKADSRYANENGKPVIAIFGFTGNSTVDNTTALSVVNWLKGQGAYVWGGLPQGWRNNLGTSDGSGTSYDTLYGSFNAISAWHSSAYATDISKTPTGVQYWPMIWPGFSWLNEHGSNSAFKDRFQGNFYWNGETTSGVPGVDGIYGAASACRASQLGGWPIFVGMFDEYDEGTAIMPMTDDYPSPGAFIDNESMASDWWLALTGEAKAMMIGQRTPVSQTMPASSLVRSNIGPQAYVDVASTIGADVTVQLNRAEVSLDGKTAGATAGGKDCRHNLDAYLYFAVDDDFIYQYPSGTAVTIELEYYDGANITFGLEYDAAGGTGYTAHLKQVSTEGTNNWRTVRFEIPDAYFGNRENAGALGGGSTTANSDFRFHVFGGATLNINRVWVRKADADFGTWIASAAIPTTPYGAAPTWKRDDVKLLANGSVAADIDEVNNAYQLVASANTDIGGSGNDAGFAFLDRAMNGDGQILAKVTALKNTGTGRKAGISIRESIYANSMHATAFVSPVTNGVSISYQRRNSNGTTPTTTTLAGPFTLPVWLKIVRASDVFTGYYSTDGITWNSIGSSSNTMGAPALTGVMVCSGSNNASQTEGDFAFVSVVQ